MEKSKRHLEGKEKKKGVGRPLKASFLPEQVPQRVLFLQGSNGRVGNRSSYLMLSRQPESGFKMAVWWNIL